ncbi:MAG: hypothetical protein P8129_23385, partial [Anaerolineae bacterium]
MKGPRIVTIIVVLAILLPLAASMGQAQGPGPEGAGIQAALGTGFTYQGRLTDGGSPANGSYDFEFMLYDDPVMGLWVGPVVNVEDKDVADGLFTVQLDFGDVFENQALYLQIGVRPGSSTEAYTPLSPRQALTPAPYALYAEAVADHEHWGESWSGVGTGLTLSGDEGLAASGTVFGLSGTSPVGYGVMGSSGSGSNAAVYGSNSGFGPGVQGVSSDGTGVYGSTNSGAGYAGVHGHNEGEGYGVYGFSGAGDGVYGQTTSSTHTGVSGINGGGGYGVYGASASGTAIYGSTNSPSGYAAISGDNAGTGYGLRGYSSGGDGVHGQADVGDGVSGSSTSGSGVYGLSSSGYGVSGYSGSTAGVRGNSSN